MSSRALFFAERSSSLRPLQSSIFPMKKLLICGIATVLLVAAAHLVAQVPATKDIATKKNFALKDRPVLTRDNKAVVSLEVDAATKTTVLDGTGRDITQVRATTPNVRQLTLELARHEVVTVLENQVAPSLSPLALGRKYFPGTLVAAVDDPKKSGQLSIFKGSLFIEIQAKPLQWDATAQAYRSGLTVGLEADPDSPVSQATFAKTTVTLKSSGGASVSRAAVEFTRPGVVTDLFVDVKQPAGLAGVAARHGNQTVEDQAEVGQRTAQLALTSAKIRLSGYGLEETTLTVTRLDPQGQPFAGNSPQEVQFSLEGPGKLAETNVTISAAASAATTTLTSESTGATTVRATLGTHSTTVAVTFLFPAVTLMAALAGAVLGGLARGFRLNIRNQTRWARLVGEAVVTALLFTAVVFVGLIADLVPAALARSEVGVFVIAGLAGFIGASVLDSVASKFMPRKTAG